QCAPCSTPPVLGGRRGRASRGRLGRCSRNRARPLQSAPYFFVFALACRERLRGAVVGLPDRGARDRVGQEEVTRQLVAGELVARVILELLERRLGARARLDDGGDAFDVPVVGDAH